MATVARVFIAVAVCPVMGGYVGGVLGRLAAEAERADPGVVARWEMTGLLAGAVAGLVFAALLLYCVMGCGGRLRRRIADPVILALGAVGAVDLVAHSRNLPPPAIRAEEAVTVLAWLVGLLFVVLGVRYRPGGRGPSAPQPLGEVDGHV